MNILELARIGKIKRVVFTSSAAVYGPLDIRRAQEELSFSVARDLKGSLEHFIETLRQRQRL